MHHAGRVLPIVLSMSTLGTLGACGVGDDSELPSTPEARVCTANLAITGTFTIGAMAPDDVNNDTNQPPGDGRPDIMGCWPTGTWTWTMSVTDNTCPTAPVPEASYSFRTDFLPDTGGEPQYTYTLLAPALTSNFRLKVSSGGGGLCEGGLEIYSEDGKTGWIIQPALDVFNQSGPLNGKGEYAIWKEPQYP